MSSTYSRNSWPYKNIVISFFNSSWSECRVLRFRKRGGAWWVRKHRGTGRVCEGDGLIEGGWGGVKEEEAPQWQTVPLSAGCSDSELPLVDVEVSEVVKGCPQGPARLYVVHLLGQLLNRGTGGPPSPPHHADTKPHTTTQVWRAHLQHGVVLEAKALLQQTSDVSHVHAEEGADGAVFGHFVAHCKHKKQRISHTTGN